MNRAARSEVEGVFRGIAAEGAARYAGLLSEKDWRRLLKMRAAWVRSVVACASRGEWRSVALRLGHENRMPAALALGKFMDDAGYWSFLRCAWEGAEDLHRFSRHLPRLFRRSGREAFMLPEEAAAFARLPDPVPVYRGALAGVNEKGWSWTTSPDLAAWFAARFAGVSPRVTGIARRRPVVIAGQVSKADAIGYLNGRDEQEVVAPPRSVKVRRVERERGAMQEAADRWTARRRARSPRAWKGQ